MYTERRFNDDNSNNVISYLLAFVLNNVLRTTQLMVSVSGTISYWKSNLFRALILLDYVDLSRFQYDGMVEGLHHRNQIQP